jgi:hypothetical protein
MPEWSSWPTAKIERARELATTLGVEIETWVTSAPIEVTISKTSPTVLEVRQRMTSIPPTERWSLAFGEILHNARGALDAMTWELCHLDDKFPDDPKRVQFPIITNHAPRPSTRLNNALEKIRSMPAHHLARIIEVQPIKYKQSKNEVDPLELLDFFSNLDKHRGSVEAQLAMDALEHRFKYPVESYPTPPPIEFQWLASGTFPPPDDELLMRLVSEIPYPSGFEVVGGLQAQVVLPWRGSTLAIGPVVNQIIRAAEATMRYVRDGR